MPGTHTRTNNDNIHKITADVFKMVLQIIADRTASLEAPRMGYTRNGHEIDDQNIAKTIGVMYLSLVHTYA